MSAPAVPTTPAAASRDPGPRLVALDGVRGIASIAVFVFHGWLYTRETPGAGNRNAFGDFAVHELRLGLIAFFVMSGFLLYRRFLLAALGDGPRVNLTVYVRSRVARIAPAYYVALLGSLALVWSLSGDFVRLPPAEELPLFFIFAQNYSEASVLTLDPPMWSLIVEVSFYAVLPLLGLLALRLPRRPAFQAIIPVALIIGGLGFSWAIAGQDLGVSISKNLLATAQYFGLGMLAAFVLHVRPPARGLRTPLLALGALIVLADATAKGGAAAGWYDPGDTWLILRDLPSGFGFALCFLAMGVASSRRGLLEHRLPVFLGVISYGFYLWHVPVIWFMRDHGLLPMDAVLGSLAAFGPSLALAWLSWILLERRAIDWSVRRNRRTLRSAGSASGRGPGGRSRRDVGPVRV